MRLLLLSLYYAPDPAANSVIMTELAEALADRGHQVTVVTAFPHYDVNRIWDRYRGRLLQRDERHGVRIIRCFLYVPQNKSSLPGRLLSYLSFNLLSTVIGLFSGRHDVILAPSPPLTIGFSAYLIGRIRRTPFVYNVQDIYPDIAIRLGVLTNARLIRFFRWLEGFVYDRARMVTVLSAGFRQNLLAKGVPEARIEVIPNFVDVAFIRPGPRRNAFAREYALEDRFVVLYAGNVGLSQGLDVILDAATLLRSEKTIHFLIVGNGVAVEGLSRRMQQDNLANVQLLPFQPRDRLPELYATADVSLVCLAGAIGEESVPSKAYTIMASGRPMIASVSADSATRHLIEMARCGIWVEPQNGPALAAAVRTLHRDGRRREILGANGRAFVVAHHTPEAVACQYERLLVKCRRQVEPERVAL